MQEVGKNSGMLVVI